MTTAHQLARKLLEAPNFEVVMRETGSAFACRVVDLDLAVNYTSPESCHYVPAIALTSSLIVDKVPVHKDPKPHLRAMPPLEPRASYKEFPVGTSVFVRDHDAEWDNSEMGCLDPFGARGVITKSTDDGQLGNGDRIFVRFTDKEVNGHNIPLMKTHVCALKASTLGARLPR